MVACLMHRNVQSRTSNIILIHICNNQLGGGVVTCQQAECTSRKVQSDDVEEVKQGEGKTFCFVEKGSSFRRHQASTKAIEKVLQVLLLIHTARVPILVRCKCLHQHGSFVKTTGVQEQCHTSTRLDRGDSTT